jgi:hypothetical protein
VKHDGNGGVAFLLRMVAAFEAAFRAGKDYFGHRQPCHFPAAALVDKAGLHI